jgi:virulence-associated protein VapD
LKRLCFIDDLSQKGMENAQIADFLNKRGMKTPTGLVYTAQNVFDAMYKFKKRKKRIAATKVSVDQDYFFVKARRHSVPLSNLKDLRFIGDT